jgi:hypothetical protein
LLSFILSFGATNDNISNLHGENANDGLFAAARDQTATANQPPHAAPSTPEALFHLLGITLLLKHVRRLTGEKRVNGKAFYKTHINWEELNQTQRDKSMNFWVSNLTDDIHVAIRLLWRMS